MTPGDFSDLLERTKEAFDQSRVKTIAADAGEQWYYSICSTRIVPGSVLIVGFNWGADKTKPHCPQKAMPNKKFFDLDDLGTFVRITENLLTYLNLPPAELHNIGQTNYCFFRSRTDSQIDSHDLDLCEPLFNRFLELALPSKLLSFSSRLREHFSRSGLLIDPDWIDIPLHKGMFKAGKGKLHLQDTLVPIVFLPHPNYPMRREARTRAWEYCFKDSGR